MTQRLFAGLIVLLFLNACSPDKLNVDISNVNIEPLKCQRLDVDLFSVSEQNFNETNTKMKAAYGPFYEHYITSFLNRGGTQDSLYKKNLLSFTSDKDVRGSYNAVKKLYPESYTNTLTSDINDCVKRFKYHFPKRRLPKKLVGCITGWNYASAYTDSTLVIGLDMYLGDTSIYYQMLQLPQYRTHYMNQHYILPDLMRGWMITEFDNADPKNTLVNHTIFYGKIYYAVNALLPQINDTLLMAYSAKQMDYCKQYEKNLWGYFAEKNRLYENNMKTIQELTTEGPFTGAISKECPPRIAMWVGLQIVRSYMENNKEATLEQLMNEKDAQKILAKSKYRP